MLLNELKMTPTQAELHREHMLRRMRLSGVLQQKPAFPVQTDLSSVTVTAAISGKMIAPPDEQTNLIREIIGTVCHVSGLMRNDIIADRRSDRHIRARHIAMMLAYMLTEKSTITIGREFGGRDHTSILHAVWKLEVVAEYVRKHSYPSISLRERVELAFAGYDELVMPEIIKRRLEGAAKTARKRMDGLACR